MNKVAESYFQGFLVLCFWRSGWVILDWVSKQIFKEDETKGALIMFILSCICLFFLDWWKRDW